MKTIAITAATVAALALPAAAGGPTVVADDPMPAAMAAPAAAHNWSGPYVGLSYGRTSGSLDYENPDFSYDVENGTARSIYAGYLLQRGNFVYGGELAYSTLKDTQIVGFPAESYTKALDLKGRFGVANGRMLAYGLLGWSKVDFERTGVTTDYNGWAYGAGVEFAATNSLSVGLEYMARTVDGTSPNGAPQTVTLGLDTLSLRVGLSF
jgi:outer membrane immunogenic protein